MDDIKPPKTRGQERYEDRYRSRRQRKGQRAFNESQRKRAFQQDTVRAQMAVLEAGPDHPNYTAVYNALVAKYGDAFPAT